VVKAALAAMASVALLCIVSDVLFRSILPAAYLALFVPAHLPATMIAFTINAIGEELVFRLGVMSVLLFGLMAALRRSAPEPAIVFIAAVLAQLLNLARFGVPHGWEEIIHWMLRYLAPGIVWGWLYWRYSFATALFAHAGTHLVLDPALSCFL